MENPQQTLALENALLDEELTERIGAALKEAGQGTSFRKMLPCLNQARTLFGKLMLHRRRVLNHSPDSWRELRALLLRIHELENKTLTAARTATRF